MGRVERCALDHQQFVLRVNVERSVHTNANDGLPNSDPARWERLLTPCLQSLRIPVL